MARHFLAQFLRLMLVPVGAMVVILSGFGVLINYSELGGDSCSEPQPLQPVCGSIAWFIVELLILASIGAALVYFGLGVKLNRRET
ncbi:MAG: hypothetical protein ABSB26_08730 [Nitrososphaerales archaeon]